MDWIPARVVSALADSVFSRRDARCVAEVLARLAVAPSLEFVEFFRHFTGGYRSEKHNRLLLDLCEGRPTIVDQTILGRRHLHFPAHLLVLTEPEANSLLVLDSNTNEVYEVDLAGGDTMLLTGELNARWPSFFEFLADFID